MEATPFRRSFAIFRRILSRIILPLFSAGFLVWISALLLFTSCSTSRHIQTQLVEKVSKDTIYLSNIQYDSIYVLHKKYTDRSKDTLFIKETNIEYRYKLLRDTIRIVQRDSIPYEVRITEVKEVKYIPPWTKALAYIGSISILFLLIYIFTKLKRF